MIPMRDDFTVFMIDLWVDFGSEGGQAVYGVHLQSDT